MENKVWMENKGAFTLQKLGSNHQVLPNNIYVIKYDLDNRKFYLQRLFSEFTFEDKIYNVEEVFINHVVKTLEHSNRNEGILLNGVKGTGKTVTAKLICSRIQLPVLIIDQDLTDYGLIGFLSELNQDVIIFIDEYEKIFEERSNMLSLMDGVLKSTTKKIFILTTNHLHIDQNMIDRPSRIRYLKTFEGLNAQTIIEIVDDKLQLPEFKTDILTYLAQLELLTIDGVISICNEVNLHKVSPTVFGSFFNLSKKEVRCNFSFVNSDNFMSIVPNILADCYYNIYDSDDDHRELYVDGGYVGSIVEAIDDFLEIDMLYAKHQTRILNVLSSKLFEHYELTPKHFEDANFSFIIKDQIRITPYDTNRWKINIVLKKQPIYKLSHFGKSLII